MGELYRLLQIFVQFRVGINHLHSAAADDKGWTHHQRIPQPRSRLKSFFSGSDRTSFRRGDIQNVQKIGEFLTILRQIDILVLGAQNLYASGRKLLCQIQRSLSAELENHTVRSFLFDHIHHIVGVQRFEVELVGRIEVGADRFRIVVDDHRFIAQLLQRPHALYAAVIEFDTLADTNRARAHDQNLVVIRFSAFVFSSVAGIVIRGQRLKLACTGVNYLVDGIDIVIQPNILQNFSGHTRQIQNFIIGKPSVLRLSDQLCRDLFTLQFPLQPDDPIDLFQKPAVDSGQPEDFFYIRDIPAKSLGDAEKPLVVAAFQLFHQLFFAETRHIRNPKTRPFHFERSDGL